jgi:(S)-sulfolactate dehydrogenase
MPDIVISEFIDEAAVARFAAHYDTLYDPALVDDPARLAAQLANARAVVVRNRTQVNTALLDAGPKLLAVGRLGVGLDNIDTAACAARNIAVLPATGANAIAVAEYVLGAALWLVRAPGLSVTDAVAAGAWPRGRAIGGELKGRVLGLLGFGSIARLVAARARVFGMEIIAHDPHLPADDPAWAEASAVDFDTLIVRADVLSLHVPLTDQTWGLIGADTLGRMKPSAVLINTARGGIVDEPALAASLRAGTLAGAALDVFIEEPASVAAHFEGLTNLILSPHIAGVTAEANVRVSHVTTDHVLRVLDGAP